MTRINLKDNLRFFMENGEAVEVKAYWVTSSNVALVGYPKSGEPLMLVRYKSGKTYGYLGVPRQRVVAAAHAESVGEYVSRKIKPHYKVVNLNL